MSNEKLKKKLRKYIDYDMYANGVYADLEKDFDDMKSSCEVIITEQRYFSTKASYNNVNKAIKEPVSEFSDNVKKRLKKEADNIRIEELLFLAALYGLAFSDKIVSLANVLFTPFDNRDTVDTFADRLYTNVTQTYNQAFRSGYIFGQSSDNIKAQTAVRLNQIKNGFKSGVKTAIPSFAKATDIQFYDAKKMSVTWISTLEGNTCIACGSLHGTTYKSIADLPPFPMHDNCRCIITATEDIDSDIPSYEEYISELSDEEQKTVLGKSRYELYKSGVPVTKFISNGHILTLDELRQTIQ